jgi:hypothetical protein
LAGPGKILKAAVPQSLFDSFSSEKEQYLLFLKKKKPEDFCFCAAGQKRCAALTKTSGGCFRFGGFTLAWLGIRGVPAERAIGG